MKIESYIYPKSSFLSMEKDMGLIVDHILKNENLKKLLFYDTKDCLKKPKLTDDQSLQLFGKNIKIIPKIYADESILNYMIITFDNFSTNDFNPEFRDNTVSFEIICHLSQWELEDFALRPYRIAAELDSMFNEKHLTGIGVLNFIGASQVLLSDEFAGIVLMYQAVHGEEDKEDIPNPERNKQFIENFNQIFND